MAIIENAAGDELAYPSTVQLPDGHRWTAWYERPAGRERAGLRLAEWMFDDGEKR